MSCINRILVPIDLSPCSASALEYAAFVGAHSGAHLQVLHVVERAHDADTSGDDIYSPRRQALHVRLEALVGEALSHSAADVEVSVTSGEAAEAILAAAKEGRADLIVMGKYGERALDPSHPGNVVEAVSQGSDCAVVPVHEGFLDGHAFCLGAPQLNNTVAQERRERAAEREERQMAAISANAGASAMGARAAAPRDRGGIAHH